MLTIPFPTNVREIIRGKFLRTISEIEAVYQEAEGDIEIGQTYSAEGVFGRIENIKEAFEKDLENLIKEIKLETTV